jgi:hypothetical protein
LVANGFINQRFALMELWNALRLDWLLSFSEIEGLDYTETFSLFIKPGKIRTILLVALMKGWDIRQFDVKNALLHGHLSELVYIEQPSDFKDIDYADYVCRLKKTLYALKQAPRAWFDYLSGFLLPWGFIVALLILLCLFVKISKVTSFPFYMLMICWLLVIILLSSIILFLC